MCCVCGGGAQILKVASGDCTVADRCIMSANWPNYYGINSECTFTNVPAVPMDVKWFDIEGGGVAMGRGDAYYDYLLLNGKKYTGYYDPLSSGEARQVSGIVDWAVGEWYNHGNTPWPHGVVVNNGVIKFKSSADTGASGFKICFPTDANAQDSKTDVIAPATYTRQTTAYAAEISDGVRPAATNGMPSWYTTDDQCGETPKWEKCVQNGKRHLVGQGGLNSAMWLGGSAISSIITINDPAGGYSIASEDALFGLRLSAPVTGKVVMADPPTCAFSPAQSTSDSNIDGLKGYIKNADALAGNIVMCVRSEYKSRRAFFSAMAQSISYNVPTAKGIILVSNLEKAGGFLADGFALCSGGSVPDHWGQQLYGGRAHPDVVRASCSIPMMSVAKMDKAKLLAAPSVTLAPATPEAGIVHKGINVAFPAASLSTINALSSAEHKSMLLGFQGDYVPLPKRCAKLQWGPDYNGLRSTPNRLWGYVGDAARDPSKSSSPCNNIQRSDQAASHIKYVKASDLAATDFPNNVKHWLAYKAYDGRSAGYAAGAWVFMQSKSEELPNGEYKGNCREEGNEICPGPDIGERYSVNTNTNGYTNDAGEYGVLAVSQEKLRQDDANGEKSKFPWASVPFTSHSSTGYSISVMVSIAPTAALNGVVLTVDQPDPHYTSYCAGCTDGVFSLMSNTIAHDLDSARSGALTAWAAVPSAGWDATVRVKISVADTSSASKIACGLSTYSAPDGSTLPFLSGIIKWDDQCSGAGSAFYRTLSAGSSSVSAGQTAVAATNSSGGGRRLRGADDYGADDYGADEEMQGGVGRRLASSYNNCDIADGVFNQWTWISLTRSSSGQFEAWWHPSTADAVPSAGWNKMTSFTLSSTPDRIALVQKTGNTGSSSCEFRSLTVTASGRRLRGADDYGADDYGADDYGADDYGADEEMQGGVISSPPGQSNASSHPVPSPSFHPPPLPSSLIEPHPDAVKRAHRALGSEEEVLFAGEALGDF